MDYRNLSNNVIDTLYRVANQLEAAWSNKRLKIDFRDHMIDLVVAYADRRGLELTERDASKLLRSFWHANACRDTSRSLKSSTTPRFVELEEAHATVVQPDGILTLCLFDSCREILRESDIRPEIAEVFLLEAEFGDLDEAIEAVEASLGFRIRKDNVRNWRYRGHFAKIQEILRREADSIGIPVPSRDAVGSEMAF